MYNIVLSIAAFIMMTGSLSAGFRPAENYSIRSLIDATSMDPVLNPCGAGIESGFEDVEVGLDRKLYLSSYRGLIPPAEGADPDRSPGGIYRYSLIDGTCELFAKIPWRHCGRWTRCRSTHR